MKQAIFFLIVFFFPFILKSHPDFKSDSISKIQLCLILDVSGSMQGLLSQAQNEIWKTLSFLEHFEKDSLETVVEIAVLSHGNNYYAESGHVKTIADFTTNVDEVAGKLLNMETGGGNEFCGQAIQHALDSLEWSEAEIFKCIIIAGNESFAQGDLYFAEAIKSCAEKKVFVNTIYCGDWEQGVVMQWDTAAILGKGQYANINQNIDLEEFETPYDYNLLKFYFDYKSTYLIEKKEEQNWREKYVTRRGEVSPAFRDMVMYKFKRRKKDPDLIDRFNDSNWELDEFDPAEIPAQWQGMEKNRLKFKLLEMSRKRDMYEKGVQLYIEKVEEFLTISIAPKLEEKTLDLAMRNMLEQQLAAFGYRKIQKRN